MSHFTHTSLLPPFSHTLDPLCPGRAITVQSVAGQRRGRKERRYVSIEKKTHKNIQAGGGGDQGAGDVPVGGRQDGLGAAAGAGVQGAGKLEAGPEAGGQGGGGGAVHRGRGAARHRLHTHAAGGPGTKEKKYVPAVLTQEAN